jgi:hypothetical protein
MAARKTRTITTEWRAVQQTGERVGRILFRGLEHDVKAFIESRYPRPHVDEFTANPDNPVHDVKLVSPDGTESVFNSHTHANGGWMNRPDYDQDTPEPQDNVESEYETQVTA